MTHFPLSTKEATALAWTEKSWLARKREALSTELKSPQSVRPIYSLKAKNSVLEIDANAAEHGKAIKSSIGVCGHYDDWSGNKAIVNLSIPILLQKKDDKRFHDLKTITYQMKSQLPETTGFILIARHSRFSQGFVFKLSLIHI